MRLFIQVCHAVQHAHQKGIIHRDIKASNVLVTRENGEPVAKMIDFGVAKAVYGRLSEKTLFTGQGQLVGTPEYMRPEQMEPSNLDIDIRTGIHSLGALLYELLAWAPSFLTRATWKKLSLFCAKRSRRRPTRSAPGTGARRPQRATWAIA